MEAAVLEKLVREQFNYLDGKDFAGCLAMMSDECQVVDEISGTWLRGLFAIAEYLDALGPRIVDLKSTLEGFAVTGIGDVGLVTCMLHQTFWRDGTMVSSTAPLTVVLVRSPEDWKIVLIHAVALPPAGGTGVGEGMGI